jgi:guanyl-specific ribonuclease Sa
MSSAAKRVLGLSLAALVLVALAVSTRHTPEPRASAAPAERPIDGTGSTDGSMDRAARTTETDLPIEARETLDKIASGGPYPYERDGSIFQNREHRLPDRPRGYYREYTVETPGSSDRGARRVVAGGDPPEVFYYTDDHYRTFRRVEAPDGRR